jgi:hypothetical protein
VTAVNSYAAATRPSLPKLSLMGEDESYDKDYYPDGRIWIPPTVTGAREFLVPVFITNNWFTYQDAQGKSLYKVAPITSFEFSVFYNEKAIRAIGVEQVNPTNFDTGYDPLAKDFTIKTDDAKDPYYWYYINPQKWADAKDNLDGRRIVITGTSIKPLPTTDPEIIEYKVLCYIRFRVVAVRADGNSGFNLIQTTPIYIDNRTVRYNEMNVATDFAWQHMLDYDTSGGNYSKLYSRGTIGINRPRLDNKLFMPDTYLDGLTNAQISEDDADIIMPGPLQDGSMFNTEPVYPGVITLKISDNVPKIRVASITDDELETIPLNDPSKSLYDLGNIVSVDDNSPEQRGSARIKITNNTSKSRLNNVIIETDAEWLRVAKDVLNENRNLTILNNGRDASIKWIDNGILGEVLDPVMKVTQDDGDVLLQINCDPTQLPKDANGETHGVHIGYITIKSDYADVSPVRLKVTFYFLKNPYEPDWTKAPGNPGGINMFLTNRVNQQLRIVFGTGDRATDDVDNLYGETAWGIPMSTTQFDARWFPMNPSVINAPYGFADFAPNILNPRSRSRDIRAFNMPKGINSYIYWCKFNNLNQDYPVTIEWDLNDFPKDAQLYIRTIINGEAGTAIDMREATAVNETRRSITITDTRVREFKIEYTLPTTINFIDEGGNPIIKRGWNLLSLPLRPENSKWNVVYKSAINIPWAFVNSQYQQRDILRFGEGYFIKYPNALDTKFAGALVREISRDGNGIKVFSGDAVDPGQTQYKGGWCLVGALSVPTSVEGISFEASSNGNLPDADYTKRYGVYGYRSESLTDPTLPVGYYEVSNLVPGMGYWIKVSNDGYFHLKQNPLGKTDKNEYIIEKQNILNTSDAITIHDNAQRVSNVYMTNRNDININYFELPPTPPSGLFDARFADGKYLSNNNNSVIKFQSVVYPISITINASNANYTLIDPVTNEVYGNVKAGKTGIIEIKNLPYNSVKISKTEVANPSEFSFNVYPNPAKELSTITYNITENQFVTVEIFDALGNKVSTLVNEFKNAGEYNEVYDFSNFITGNYIAKINAGKNSSVVKINVVK